MISGSIPRLDVEAGLLRAGFLELSQVGSQRRRRGRSEDSTRCLGREAVPAEIQGLER